MTITSQTTRQGKVIYLLSPCDLGDAVERGERLRAYCPIHGGDHQRSLSIDSSTGWGYCHCCHATVLVKAIGSSFVSRRNDSQGWHGCGGDAFAPSPGADHRSSSLRPSLLPTRPAAIAHAARIGYVSRSAWERAPVSAEHLLLLKRWIGRIVFPLGSPAGGGFIGRTLLRWEPGMDENTHKALLDRPGAPKRWVKTNPAGWFGFDTPGRLADWIVLVEGGFDCLALLAAGFPATTVIALVGTAARPAWLARSAPQVKDVALALDADLGGKTAMERLADEFRQAGLSVTLCPPPHDQWGKDWSERWRRLGPQSMWS